MVVGKTNCKGEMGDGAGHYQEGHWGRADSYTCYFIMALLSKVTMFALFQCFSIFQQATNTFALHKGYKVHLKMDRT
jgi:hypothetical protein